MTVKEEFKNADKEFVYDMYDALVYECKDYDNISRTKMLDEILKEFKQENYLLFLCTKRELDFLEYANKHKLSKEDKEKYEWEIDTLNKKCIFSKKTYEIFEDQKENVEQTLKDFREIPYNTYELISIIIGLIRTYGNIPLEVLKMMITSLDEVTAELFDMLVISPLFHFYCGFCTGPIGDGTVEEVYYRDYYLWLDELLYARMEYGIGGTMPVNLQDYIDVFYYGFPIRKPKVKKMCDAIKDIPLLELKDLEYARVCNNRDILEDMIEDEKLLKTINEGLDESPCAAMNGYTPIERAKHMEKKVDIELKFTRVPQNDAHLCKRAADEYYELYFALLEYTNNHYKINSNIDKIYRQLNLDQRELVAIDNYLWEHKEIIDEFIEKNEYSMKEEQLGKIAEFKSAISSDKFVVVGFERNYTEILDPEEGKLYMVKGIRVNLDEIVGMLKIPRIIKTTLLMFDGKIIFNSLMSSYNVEFGPEWDEMIFKQKEEAIKYYHL